MPIPDYQTLMLPVLRLSVDGESRVPDIAERIAAEFGLTATEREQLLPSGRQRLLHNRVHWAKFYMGKAGLLDTPRRGRFVASETGRALLDEKPERIYVERLLTYSAYHRGVYSRFFETKWRTFVFLILSFLGLTKVEAAEQEITHANHLELLDGDKRPFVHCHQNGSVFVCNPSSGLFVWCLKGDDLKKIEEKATSASGRTEISLSLTQKDGTCGITPFVVMNQADFPETTASGKLHPQVSNKLFVDVGPGGSYETYASAKEKEQHVTSKMDADRSEKLNGTEVLPITSKKPGCQTFKEGETLSFKGYVVEYDQTEETFVPHTTMALRLDAPICFSGSPNEEVDTIDTIDISDVSRALMGHHVRATAMMVAGDGWSADVQQIAADELNRTGDVFWEHVYADQYVDTKSIRESGVFGVRLASILNNYHSINSKMVFGHSEIETVSFDCQRSAYKSLGTKWFQELMSAGNVTKTFGVGRPGPIPPFYINAFSRVCSPDR